jgi:transposase
LKKLYFFENTCNPAYSQDFNPIEFIFSKLKTLYRKLEHNNIIEEVKSVINKITESDLLQLFSKKV